MTITEKQHEALWAVAEAARELRDTKRHYVRVSLNVEEWMEASIAELQAEVRLDDALEALKQVVP